MIFYLIFKYQSKIQFYVGELNFIIFLIQLKFFTIYIQWVVEIKNSSDLVAYLFSLVLKV